MKSYSANSKHNFKLVILIKITYSTSGNFGDSPQISGAPSSPILSRSFKRLEETCINQSLVKFC